MKGKTNKPTIIFIVAHGHSGSTLLDKVLGNHTDGVSLGGIQFYSDLVSSSTVFCGCGSVYSECSFWSRISNEVKISFSCDGLVSSRTDFVRKRTVLRDLSTMLLNMTFGYKSFSGRVKKSLLLNKKLYDVVLQDTGASFLVDSSKRLERALFIQKAFKKEFHFKYVHLVRDGRSVLSSFHRKKITFKITDPLTNEEKTHTRSKKKVAPEKVILNWMLVNVFSSAVLNIFRRRDKVFVKYEEFCEHPDAMANEIYRYFGLSVQENISDLTNNVNHMMGGHASRVNAKKVHSPEVSWPKTLPKEILNRFHQISGWLNRLYGYK